MFVKIKNSRKHNRDSNLPEVDLQKMGNDKISLSLHTNILPRLVRIYPLRKIDNTNNILWVQLTICNI
jgi:hypothetical protein